MKKLLFTTIAAGFLAVSASAAAVAPSKGSNDCYQIGTADELDGFAQKVNVSKEYTACAELTADIYYNGTEKILSDDLRSLARTPSRVWTPIGEDNNNPFRGSIDGKNHTIYGLYLERQWEPAFVKKAGNGAKIKNLVIADSYFATVSGGGDAGGFIGDVIATSTAVELENCGFEGIVNGVTGSSKNGGLVGSIGSQAKLTMTYCYNAGAVIGGGLDGNGKNNGGLIGYINPGKKRLSSCSATTTLTMNDCYNVGYPSVMLAGRDGVCDSPDNGENNGCVGDGCQSYEYDNGKTAGLSTEVYESKDALLTKFWNSVGLEKIQEMIGDDIAGIELETVTDEKGDPALGAKVKTTLSDGETSLVMPRTISVYAVDVERTFNAYSSESTREECKSGFSTSVLPIELPAANVSGAFFYTPVVFHEVDGVWTIGLEAVVAGTLKAHTPYIVCPTAEKMTINGGAEIVKTEGPAGTVSFDRDPVDVGSWTLVGLYSERKFTEEDDEAGRIYGFSGGEFVKVNTGKSKILRAYLLAPEGSVKPSKTARVLAKTAATDALPERISIEILGTDEYKYEKVESVDVPSVEEDADEEGTLSIQNALILRKNTDKNQWKDVKGRSMDRKPTAKGAYLNNNIPVIVK